ncbi:hypothetical protein V6Z12_D07G193200 [Gossypium hirsutum]
MVGYTRLDSARIFLVLIQTTVRLLLLKTFHLQTRIQWREDK